MLSTRENFAGMTVAASVRKAGPFHGNDLAFSFAFDFKVFSKTDVGVTKMVVATGVETTLVLDADYSVSLNPNQDTNPGGSISLLSGAVLATGTDLVIASVVPESQGYDITNTGGFLPTSNEDAFDRVMIVLQQLIEKFARIIRYPVSDPVLGTTLPAAAQRANKFIAFDGNGNVIVSAGGISPAIPVSAFMQTVVDDADTRTVFNTFGVAAAQALGAMGQPLNFSLAASVGANALTPAVKGSDGNNPSATNPVWVPFRSSNAALGSIVWRSIPGALSLTVSSGSTLGHNSGLKQYIYHYLIDNGGVVEYAVSSKFFGWHGIVSTTAEGGAGAADSGTVMYSATARANVPFLCVAITEDTQAAAGTWATAPSSVRLAPFEHPLLSFSVHKNGVNQVGVVSAADTRVTFSTEIYDNGSLFDIATSRWTPPPGTVELTAALAYVTFADASTLSARIFKNGASFRDVYDVSASAAQTGVNAQIDDECNGTDFYEFFTNQTTGANKDIRGATTDTYFMGSWSPQRS